jgi:hypothetical protein
MMLMLMMLMMKKKKKEKMMVMMEMLPFSPELLLPFARSYFRLPGADADCLELLPLLPDGVADCLLRDAAVCSELLPSARS